MDSKQWQEKAYYCPVITRPGKVNVHKWMPIAFQLTDKTKHVTTLMCEKCFHEINISDAFDHRIKLKND